jgi:hypothetical protein
MYGLGKSIGTSDQKWFMKIVDLNLNAIEKAQALPVNMAYLGLCDLNFTDGLSSSEFSEKREKFEITCIANGSFESDSWIRSNYPFSSHTCCYLLAGYIAGWLELSFGVPVTCIERACRISKSPTCEFFITYTHNTAALFPSDVKEYPFSTQIHRFATFQSLYNNTPDFPDLNRLEKSRKSPTRTGTRARSTDSRNANRRRSGQSPPKSTSPPPRKPTSEKNSRNFTKNNQTKFLRFSTLP